MKSCLLMQQSSSAGSICTMISSGWFLMLAPLILGKPKESPQPAAPPVSNISLPACWAVGSLNAGQRGYPSSLSSSSGPRSCCSQVVSPKRQPFVRPLWSSPSNYANWLGWSTRQGKRKWKNCWNHLDLCCTCGSRDRELRFRTVSWPARWTVWGRLMCRGYL